MKSAVAASAFVAALQMSAVQGTLTERQSTGITINTPMNLVTCEVTAITWNGGTPPFFVSIYPGGTTSNPYIQFASVPASPIEWKVNISAGTAVTFGISDGKGLQNANQQVTITAGPDTSCITGGSGSTGSSSTTNSTGSGGSSGGSGSGTGGNGGSGPGSGASPTPSGSGSPPASTGNGGSGAGMIKAGMTTLALGGLAALFL